MQRSLSCFLLLVVAAVSEPQAASTRAASKPSVAGPQEEALDTRALWRVAKDRRSSVEERVAALNHLAHLGPEQALLVLEHTARECGRLAKARFANEERMAKEFVKSAPRLLASRRGRAEEKAIDADRSLVLGHARAGELQKQTIVAESDPALGRLRALLVIDVDEVFVSDEDLGSRLAAYDEAGFDEGAMRDVFLGARPLAAADPAMARRAERLDTPADPVAGADALRARLVLEARLATPMTKGDRKVLEANRRLFEETGLDSEETLGIRHTNDIRILLGLSALRFDVKLGKAARSHSKDMVEHGFFAHDSPLEGRETPWKRAAQEGTSASAENIAAGHRTGHGAVQAWWHSPGHHKNLLGGHARIGLGCHADHWTQLFGG